MKVHWFQHQAFEGLGAIEPWLQAHGHSVASTRLYAGETPPADAAGYDWLIIMGGTMNVYQYRDHPWLPAEKRAIHAAITAGKRVLGICLGAQLIADVLGGKVYQNPECEIGWFPVRAVPAGAASPLAFADGTMVFHWHGDTFALPPGSTWLAESAGCAHQAFAVGPRVLGLQFHLEMTAAELRRIGQAGPVELAPGRFVQPMETMIALADEHGAAAGKLLDRLLTGLSRN